MGKQKSFHMNWEERLGVITARIRESVDLIRKYRGYEYRKLSKLKDVEALQQMEQEVKE